MTREQLRADSALDGDLHLAPLLRGRTALLANHLSYADANVIEVLLRRAGADTLANRMTAIAGPKVFTNRWVVPSDWSAPRTCFRWVRPRFVPLDAARQ